MLTYIATLIVSTVLSLTPNSLENSTALLPAVKMDSDKVHLSQEENTIKAKALFEQGFEYQYGVNQRQDSRLVHEYFRESAKLGNTDAMIFLAVDLFNEGDMTQATEYANAALKAGNEAANYMLGFLSERRPLSQAEAEEFYKKGFTALKAKFEQGDWHYAGWLGYAYLQGIGTEENRQLAIQAFTRAMEHGVVSAIGQLGYIALMDRDIEKAKTLLLKAAELNDAFAQSHLGFAVYKEGSKESLYWLDKAAENGNGEAIWHLAEYYREKDPKKTLYYYQKGAEMNDPDSLLALSELYEDGDIVEENPQKALEFLKRAAKAGNGDAITELVKRYLTGTGGVEKDEKQAAYWFKELGFKDDESDDVFEILKKDILKPSLRAFENNSSDKNR